MFNTYSRQNGSRALTLILFVSVVSLMLGCDTTKSRKVAGVDLDSWIQQNRLSEVSESDVIIAKSSEVPWMKDHADLGSGMSLKLHQGDILGTGQVSTTSHYGLTDANGRTLVKLPSRLSRQDENPEYSETKVWASQDHELLLVYESRRDATGDREFHAVIYKTLDGYWLANGVELPRWVDNTEALRKAKQEGVWGNPVFHDGPFAVGVINGAVVLLPVNGRYFSVNPDHLKSSHPFPFSIG